ncbi:hypothetical protein C5167_049575 [Papaver somniferum]|uniref:Plastid lipid-associated protein/fibrillin conserved domain-containing protein n=1 Tax=Papaver somniferum TaxID=3469 RepID=A0A4Y7KL68_PAPSO|nr:probable plastid-lipid-associated protein 3, chloroplastic [Papaver somniferum]RZC74094.1 hypothetical protein C5167_049575 [Papaver somniferum]
MALYLTTSQPSSTSLLSQNLGNYFSSSRIHSQNPNLSLSLSKRTSRNFSSFRIRSSNEENEQKPLPSKSSESDPPENEDEWGGGGGEEEVVVGGRDYGTAGVNVNETDDDKLGDLKRCLVDTFYGTELGFKASGEVRAEVLELVNQLESLNPTPAPTEAASLLDGNWTLLYTAFSELLPLLATGKLPLVEVKQISQSINTTALTIDNSTTLSGPFGTFSFSALATYEVRSPSRIQVRFKEGSLEPPKISSNFSLPQNIDIFGQKVDLSPVQSSLINPLEDVVANISRLISGQAPLKVPIPGERSSSFLLTTYLDKDLRISRGDGGLFILAKEGSPLLDQ